MDGIQNIVASSTSQQINSENTEENASCNIYARTFRTNRGLLQHLNFCRRRNITNNGNQTIATNDDNNDNTSNSNNTNGNDIPDKIQSQEKFYWNLVAGSTSEKDLKLWDEGNIVRLLYEGTTIQKRLRFDKEGMTIAKISLKFKNLMSKGNDNGALKLLIDVACGVVLITTAQLHSSKPELRFFAGSNPARGVSEIRDGEDL